MKKIIYSAMMALAALAVASCTGKQFQINGNIADAKDSVLYLENVGLNGVEVIDSVKLGEDGAFSFSKDATDAPEFYRLRIAGQIVNVSIDSTETVSVKASYPTMAYQYEVEGSENCSKIKELALHQMRLQQQVNAIVADPALSVRNVEDSLTTVVEAYKENIKHNYIFKEPMKAYSYFALFQTVVVGNSYNLIFNPRSNEADVKVFAAVATSWDTFHPGAERGQNLHNIAIEGLKNIRIVRNRNNQVLDASVVDTSGIIDVKLLDNKGNERKLSDLKGKVVLLDFTVFAAEGTTERTMMLRELYNKYHAQGLEIFQVSFDPSEHFWKTQVEALPWINVRDENTTASPYINIFNLQGLPTFFLVGKDGSVSKRDAQIKDIDAEIKALL